MLSIGYSWPVEDVTKIFFSTNNTLHLIIMMISVVQCKPDISRSCISRNRIYCGRMLDLILWHFLATHFANFADMMPKSAIFREIAVIPWTPFAGDSFSPNLLTADAFDPARRRQFSEKSALGQSGLPMKCGREHMLCDGQPRKADHWHLHCITE